MCMLAPESATNSLSSGFIVDGAGKLHSLVGEKKVALSVSLSFKIFLAKSPRVSAGTSLLSLNFLLRSILKFHGVGTALMRKFDLYFTERWSFGFSDVCVTLRRTSFNFATAFLSPPFFRFLFGCCSTFLCGNEHSLPNLHPDSD